MYIDKSKASLYLFSRFRNCKPTSVSLPAMIAIQPCGLLLGAALLATVLLLLPPSLLAGPCPPAEKNCTAKDSGCKGAHCNCASELIPGGIAVNDAPQFVVITFTGPLNNDSWYQLRRLFKRDKKKRKNPNGTPTTITLFVTQKKTDDYCRAGEFYRDGHEIAVSAYKLNSTMASLKKDDWEREIMEQKKNLTKEAKVDEDDIKGMRAPDLMTGADAQFKAMLLMSNETKYKDCAWKPYDSSIVLGEKMGWKNSPPLWPYTMNYNVFDQIRPQHGHPVQCYPGVWEVPVRRFYDNYSSAYEFIDDWRSTENEEMQYYTLANNFWTHYSTNRAPFLINARTTWFKTVPTAEKALERFIDVVLAHDKQDVYVVSMDMMLDWVKNPKKLSDITELDFKRTTKRRGAKCNIAKLESTGRLNGTMMLLIEGTVLFVLLVVLIAKDKAED